MGIFDKSRFVFLQDHIQDGSRKPLNDEDQHYLDTLYILNNLRRKYGKDNAIAFITKPPFSVSRQRANEMFQESINIFFANDSIERDAYRNMMYDDLIKAANVVLATATSSKDMEVYGDLMTKAAKIKGLDQPDPVKVPTELYQRNIKIYSLNPKSINIEPVNRQALADKIDSLDELKERDKKRLKQDAQIIDINFLEMYGNQETEIGSE
ncbi:MAG: hypothetical protein PHV20_12385 [Bacteroidales bacterium]|nr:hypothetical protein [Bacteroidales bacterium]